MKKPLEDKSYERKVAIKGVALPHVESLLRLHPAGFRKLYPERWINSLYLDSPELACYLENSGGVGRRVKFRVRWYGDRLGPAPAFRLELKFKAGFLRRKLVYPLPGVDITRGVQPLVEALATADLPGEIRDQVQLLRPVLLNRYARRYYTSFDGRIRVTLDREMGFYGMRGRALAPTPRVAGMPGTVMEAKYAASDDDSARAILSAFPFRLSKHSKYVIGVECLQAAGLLGGLSVCAIPRPRG